MEDRKKNTILLADDLELVRDGIARICESTGQFEEILQCGDGAVAMGMIQQMRPDVAVLDFGLPSLFSLEIVRKVRSAGLPTKAIILSSKVDRKLVLEALRSGANGFVLKSGTARHLQDALRQVLSGSIYVSPELELEKIFVSHRRNETSDPLESLSSREFQVFTLLVDGVRAKEIAARLELSPKTVDTYRASLMRKLDIHDIAGLVKFSIRRDLTKVA